MGKSYDWAIGGAPKQNNVDGEQQAIDAFEHSISKAAIEEYLDNKEALLGDW